MELDNVSFTVCWCIHSLPLNNVVSSCLSASSITTPSVYIFLSIFCNRTLSENVVKNTWDKYVYLTEKLRFVIGRKRYFMHASVKKSKLTMRQDVPAM